MKKLYVGNLLYDVTEDDLKELFSEFGEVSSVNLIKNREDNTSKGFGFVEMSEGDAADKAVEELDGQDYRGRNLRVNEARERSDGGGRGGHGGGHGGGRGGGGYGNRR